MFYSLFCRYVVDAGRSKQKLLEAHSGAAVARYSVDWVSKAAAEQRAGRAGRTGPGHVYRLFSSAHFNDNFKQHSDPEIANTPLEGVVLLLKAMGVDKVRCVMFCVAALRNTGGLCHSMIAGVGVSCFCGVCCV
jgi:HrpA-like RNA helicase